MLYREANGNRRHNTDLPIFVPAEILANEGDLPKTIVKDGKVDPDAVAKLENKGNAELSATADFIAGKFEFEHGNVDQSRRISESALRFHLPGPLPLRRFLFGLPELCRSTPITSSLERAYLARYFRAHL